MNSFTRTVALDDIAIRSGGDGRTVEAYAAVFDVEVPIADQEGRYNERIASGSFTKTIADKGTRFGVFYNHGTTILGTPSDRASVPLGTPLEVRQDGRGLLTVTRYNRTTLADEILESIRNGDIRGQSFSGRFVTSDPKTPPRGGYRPDPKTGALRTVTRHEIALREYGPTPFPAYEAASITGVRSLAELLALEELEALDDEQRARLRAALGMTTPPDLGSSAPVVPSSTPDDSGAGTEEPPADARSTPAGLTPQQRAKVALLKLRKDITR